MKDAFIQAMDHCKLEIATTIQKLSHDGIPPQILAAALGSAAGNMVGLVMDTDDETQLRAMLTGMIPVMVKDAQLAVQFRRKIGAH